MYNFDELIDRRGSGSIKWELNREDELPMWVADMDFQACPAIREAIGSCLEHGVFGYTEVTEDWYRAYMNWWRRRHQLNIERDWLIFCTGVVPAISTCVRKLTYPAENVLIQTPVYNIFYNSILNNGRNVVESPLVYNSVTREYAMDFDDLEQKLSNPQTTLMILCNPQNPSGRIWSRDELAMVGRLCKKYHVTVISDEIHCDITRPGISYVPFASVNEECRDISVTCIAPTKCFNIAGLQTAAVCVPNPVLRHKVWRGLNTDEVAEGNVFSAKAAIAAFNGGEEWLDEMRAYVSKNIQYVQEFIEEELPMLHLVRGNATYLLWIDCSELPGDSRAFTAFLRKETGLWVSNGNQYGEAGKHFIRMNVACPLSRVVDGMKRLRRGVEAYLAQ